MVIVIPEFSDFAGLDLETIIEKLCERNCHQVSVNIRQFIHKKVKKKLNLLFIGTDHFPDIQFLLFE